MRAVISCERAAEIAHLLGKGFETAAVGAFNDREECVFGQDEMPVDVVDDAIKSIDIDVHDIDAGLDGRECVLQDALAERMKLPRDVVEMVDRSGCIGLQIAFALGQGRGCRHDGRRLQRAHHLAERGEGGFGNHRNGRHEAVRSTEIGPG
jgi:hypothetical protein